MSRCGGICPRTSVSGRARAETGKERLILSFATRFGQTPRKTTFRTNSAAVTFCLAERLLRFAQQRRVANAKSSRYGLSTPGARFSARTAASAAPHNRGSLAATEALKQAEKEDLLGDNQVTTDGETPKDQNSPGSRVWRGHSGERVAQCQVKNHISTPIHLSPPDETTNENIPRRQSKERFPWRMPGGK